MTESMTSGWYYGGEGSPTGPLSWEELHAAGASGAFGPADPVWHEGYADWVPAAQIPGLLGVTASTGPAPGRRPWLLPVMVLVAAVLVGVGLGLYFGLSSRGDSDPPGVVQTTDSVVVGGGTTAGEATTSTATSATTAGTAPSSVPSTSAVAPGLTVVDQASLAVLDLGQFHELVRGASGRLVDRLGGDEAGFCAVLIALDQGHDIHQILTGALNDRLEADGTLLSADGSELAPVRLGDGFIQLSQAPGPGLAARTMLHSAVLVSYSRTEMVADTFGDSVPMNAKLAGTLTTLADIYDHFTPVRERYVELVKQEAREQAFVETTTRIATILAARGYSAEQIVEAIVLDGVTVADLDDMNSWGIKHTSGVPLRPRFAPVALAEGSGFPEAEKDASGGFVWADVEAALEAVAAASGSAAGGGQGAPGSGGSSSPGSGGVVADPDGIPNGLYLGGVYVASKPDKLVYEIPESIVELEVTDDGIAGTVEYVERYSAAEAPGEVRCIATYRRTYSGRGPVTNPLSLTLESVELEFISVEGSDCGGVEEFLTELFSKPHTITLSGTFTGKRFEGKVSATLAVRAGLEE